MKRFVPQWAVNNFKHLPLAVAANVRYRFPSRKQLTVIGVTGTDGKTTTVNMIYQILKAAGKKVSMVSTINAVIAGKSYETGFHVTSPSSMVIQKFLKQARDAGDEYVVLEITSHALDQHRFTGVKLDIGVITNITHEHLDYHKTQENYFKTKAKLIKRVRVAILNRDDQYFNRLSKMTKAKVVSFGLTKQANFNPLKFPFKLKLPGEFNILNGLAASAVVVELGIDSKTIKEALANFGDLPGRMEPVENNLGIKIFIDFAHTPNGLENALTTLRKQTKGKLISVFGSAGLRDVEKRPLMGEISAKLADLSIITAEDPRGQLEEINQQILEGVKKAGGKVDETVFIEKDRKKAIELAIKSAKNGDVVGIFGKGHETSINLDGKTELPWSDRKVVEGILNGRQTKANR